MTDVGANDGRACLHVVLKAPQKQSQQDDDTKRLLFYTKAPSEVCAMRRLTRPSDNQIKPLHSPLV